MSDLACANAHRHANMAPGPREYSDGEAGTWDECSDETGSIAAPGNGAVIAVAAGEPLFRVPPARSTLGLARWDRDPNGPRQYDSVSAAYRARSASGRVSIGNEKEQPLLGWHKSKMVALSQRFQKCLGVIM